MIAVKKIYNILFRTIFSACAFVCMAGESVGQQVDSSLFNTGEVPKLISRQFVFTEGPAADKAGNIYFTDQPKNQIWKYDTDGKLHLFMDSAGRANGLYFDRKGNLLACADKENQLWRIDSKGHVTVLVNDYKGKKLNGPNDVWVHPSGNIYFTDPYYQRTYWNRKSAELNERHVFLYSKRKIALVPVVSDLRQPNGIIGTADGRWLYVADIGAGETFKYRIQKDGRVDKGVLFTAMGSDGMTIDEKGNVYLTGNGVTVFNQEGQKIAHIPIPEKWTANVTFGGRNHDQLFITASEGIYVLRMNVRGDR